MYTYINGVDDHPLDMRFVAEKDGQKVLWLVFDTLNGNAVVGVHKSETLAILDAFKREQDTYLPDPAPEGQASVQALVQASI